ncbi:mnt isoform X2 [Musca autumnalis]|uniref:mnt isoform X2 n=1 Tax=Musca autumnalis TaxID=221902 RepID=UPI003CF64F60
MWQPSSPPPSHKNSTPRPMPTQPTAATSLANAFYGASAAAPLTTVIAAPPIGLVGNHDVKIPLNKLHVNDNMASSNSSATCFGATDTVETAPTAAQAAAAATAAAAAAAIYYNAATASTLFPSPASLGFMAHLQQYMKTRRSFGANADGGVAEVSHKPTSITPHPWPATTYDEFATNTTSKTTSNGHLLMAPTPGHATNMLMTSSSTHHSPTTSGLNGKLPATGALDLLPLDILTNTFMHLNALHLSHHMAGAITPVNSVLPSNAVESINTTTMAAAVAAAAAAATSKSYGQLPNSEAIAAAAMLSVPLNLTPPSPPAATTTTATTLPLHHPYFQMEHQRLHQQRQHQHLETLNTNSSAIKLTTSKPGESFQNDNEADYHDDDVGVHNYTTKSSSSSPMTGKSVITSTKSGVCNLFRSCNSPNTTTCNTSSSTNCDVRRALRKRNREREREREPHKRLKTGSPNSIHYRHHPLQQQQKQQHHHHHNHHLRGTPQYYNTFDVSSQEINTTTSQSPENQSNIAAIADDYNDDDDEEESLLPPPKKKWIRHYLNDENNGVTTTTAATTTTTSFMLVSNPSGLSPNPARELAVHKQHHHQCDHEDMLIDVECDDEDEQRQQQQQNRVTKSPKSPIMQTATKFTLIDSNGGIIGNADRQPMLLAATTNGGSIRIIQQPQGLNPKTISIPLNGKQIPIVTAVPYQLSPTQQQTLNNTTTTTNNNGSNSGGAGGLVHRHKQFIPLTPPPMASRKFVEPSQSRIRSYSLSSHKFSANLHHNNHHQMHVQNSNGNSGGGNSMLVDDIPPTQQHSGGYAAGSGLTSNSPPRQGGSGGSHYMHMINATGSQQAGSAGGNTHVTHVTPRRRTISSTSNGAGTREVHNKLEKNRRAHLKECYEQLKSQLSLKDEDRRKTSNLAILGEALKCVQTFKKHNQELEAEWEHLANDKINLQKRIVTLKRELGPKYEQIFSGIFPDIEVGSIPSERDTINDTHSLSSGRGSTLYSSSSSLSSGGSNGSNSNGSSNAMSSPVGAGLQTAMPTAISPVITKINSSNNNTNNSTSPITINSNHVVLQHQRKHPITTTIQAVAIPTQVVAAAGGGSGAASIAGGNNSPPIGSPNALLTFGGASGSSVPLSLTAKNISATAITRGSPTPSTPSPSPSSSSGVSSSSSLISSSPPINGVISNNGRNVTVNIPNGLKLQAANGIGGTVTAHTITGTIGNGAASAAATIIATSAPAQGVNNTNNAVAAVAGGHNQQSAFSATQTPQLQYNGGGGGGRKKNNSNNHNMIMDTKQHSHSPASEDAEQPAAKFLKVLNSTSLLSNGGGGGLNDGITANVFVNGQKMLLTNNSLMGNNNGAPHSSKLTLTNGKLFSNGSCNSSSSITTNELCRLPGGAELNILNNNNANNNPTTTTLATAFYHANGKITVLNGGLPPSSSPSSTTSLAGGPTPASTTFNGQTVTNGILLKDASSVTPLLLAAAVPSTTTSSPSSNTTNSLHFSGNFAQLLAAANSSNNNSLSVASATAGVSGHGNINGANLFTMEKANTKTASKHSHVAWRSEAAATTN